MQKLASKTEAETILKLSGAAEVYRRGLKSIAGVFDCGLEAERVAEFLSDKGYRASALTEQPVGTSICIVGIRG